jgi:glycosyltransferase involved in cell wall biosynthesis
MIDSVSVIVTCHNLEKYIDLAISSILRQDYEGPVEIVVIDDCSTDRSAEIIKSYGDSSVRYVRSPNNVGVLGATLLGLDSTTGSVVLFLDGDDVWEPTKVSRVVERFASNDRLALVTHDLEFIDSAGHGLSTHSRSSVVLNGVDTERTQVLVREGILYHRDYVWLGSALAVNRTRGDVAGFCAYARALPDIFNTYQDWPLAYWVACQANTACDYVPLKLFQYRLHAANYSSDVRDLKRAQRNFLRTKNTAEVVLDIATRYKLPEEIIRLMTRRLAYCQSLDHLYAGRRFEALSALIHGVPYLLQTPHQSLTKELVRFAIMLTVGAKFGISLKSTFANMLGR